MARSRSSSTVWRYINPAYYLKRPKRLALLFIVFVFATFFFWDRQTLLRDHEEEISKLNEEVIHLRNLLEELKNGGDMSVEKKKYSGEGGQAVKNMDSPDNILDAQRREKVKDAMLHAWSSYEKYAWGHDELQGKERLGLDPLAQFSRNYNNRVGPNVTKTSDPVQIEIEVNNLLSMGLEDELVNNPGTIEEAYNGLDLAEEQSDDDTMSIIQTDDKENFATQAWENLQLEEKEERDDTPQTKNGVDSFGGLGATLIDSLDTLYIMGLDEQFQRARKWVANSLDFNKNYDASVFETTIRLLYKVYYEFLISGPYPFEASTIWNYDSRLVNYVFQPLRVVGGLLSTYDLSGDKLFLDKAQDIADRLLPAWNTESGIPYNIINLAHGNPHNPGWTGMSHIAYSCGNMVIVSWQILVLSSLSLLLFHRGQEIENINKRTFPDDGLLPIYINPHKGTTSYSAITFGAMGDSFYEYLLKVWIQGNRTAAVSHYRKMWETSMKGLVSLVRRTTPSSFAYLGEKMGSSINDKMDELACFAPGMLALGSSGYSPDEAQKFLSLAEELGMLKGKYEIRPKQSSSSAFYFAEYPNVLLQLAWTCYNFYQSTPTKLAGENYFFNDGQDMSVGTSWNILRPETVESLFYLWRLTGNKTYQEWGWNIFQAFEKNSRVESGYVGLKDVNTGVKDNMMQSFFLAETLKYLYLLFSPSSVIPLDEWVFNTEAHPIKIVTRNDRAVNSGSSGGSQESDRQLRTRKEGRFRVHH
ncbi:hypothetical protein RDI58_009563 [Solanum bulbocastanum]|uniref:Alpha-1,2-Mannosidase n=1 Tax=Solanum bulbocastanum TaxID=147425 RepID=A0AAN8YPB3_SOLBU